MEDPPRVHADPDALLRLSALLHEEPTGDVRTNRAIARALAGLLSALGGGAVGDVRKVLEAGSWLTVDPTPGTEERLWLTRGLCHEAAVSLGRPEPHVMAAGIALRQAMGLWLHEGDPPGPPGRGRRGRWKV